MITDGALLAQIEIVTKRVLDDVLPAEKRYLEAGHETVELKSASKQERLIMQRLPHDIYHLIMERDIERDAPARERVYKTLVAHNRQGKRPTLKQLMEELGYSQLSSVHRHIETLRKLGRVKVNNGKHGLEITDVQE